MGTGRTDEFRKDAVRIALTSGLTRRQVADDLGVGLSTLNKSGEVFERKELGELPFSTAYDIVDKWSGIFSGRILVDGSRSRYG